MVIGKFGSIKPLKWIGSSHKDLKKLPGRVQDSFGFALFLAQIGKKADSTKVLKGFGSSGVLEVVESWAGSTYRAVYTVRLKGAVYVLHVFQKKSKRGIATPQQDIELIRDRLKHAEEHSKKK